MYGWAGQRLKVYLTEGKIVKEELTEDFRQEYIGGRGFNSRVLFDEVKPGIDPLSPENVFIVGTGPLVGTSAPTAARWTVTAKSPLSGALGDGNGGGDFAAELKFAGYDQVVFYGRSPVPVYLWIDDSRVELRDASHLWGKTTGEARDLLREELGSRRIRELLIGPAGENLVRFAKVISSNNKAAGKGGVGTVMGSKNLKAVVVRGTGPVKIARPVDFYNAAKHAFEKLMASPYQKLIREAGTFYLPRAEQSRGALMTRNGQSGEFEGWEKMTSEAFEAKYAVKHFGCSGCPIQCCHFYAVKEGPYATHGSNAQFGTTYPFMSKCGNDNLESALYACTLCDQLGLDTHEAGAEIAFAMEAWQKGLISAKDTDGLDLSWGNADTIVELIRKISYREGFGELFADGAKRASERIPGSESCLVILKGIGISHLYPSPELNKAYLLGHAVSTRGPDHLRGAGYRMIGNPRVAEVLGEVRAKALEDPGTYEGSGVLIALDQNALAAMNSLEICCFTGGGKKAIGLLNQHDYAGLFSAATGVEMDGEGFLKAGERIYNVEQAFNVREGLRRKDDILPDRYFAQTVTSHGIAGLDRGKYEAMLDEYYEYRGWDHQGIPTRKKLEELNLSSVAEQIGSVAA